jgi:hypothetical protein
MSLGELVRAAQKPIIDALESPLRVSHTIEYEDLEADPDMRNRIVRWFYTRLKSEWLYEDDEFRTLSRYFIVRNDKVELVASSEQYRDPAYKSQDNSEKNLRLKLNLVKKYLVSKRRVARVLEKYAKHTGTRWWDLEDKWKEIKHALYKELRRKILESIDTKIGLDAVENKKPPSVLEDEKEEKNEMSDSVWKD